MSIDCTIPGLDQFAARLASRGTAGIKAMAAALYVEGEAVMAKSKPLVPVDTGNLRASGHVQPPVIEGQMASVTLGYGGAAKEYAIPVHENLTARHTVGQAKYLEQPFLEAKDGILDRLAVTVREKLPEAGL